MHAHKASVQFDIQELMKYMLTPVPFSIATADNILAKTEPKVSLYNNVQMHVEPFEIYFSGFE